MKKYILLTAGLLFALFFENSAFAQDGKDFTDVKGVNLLNAGIGLGSYGLSGTGGLPIIASFEHGFHKNITAGATFGYITRKYASDWRYTYMMFGARASYHFNELMSLDNPKLDLYAGAGLMYRHYSFKYKGDLGGEDEYDWDSNGGDIVFDLHAGGRYMFSDNFGAYAELGYGISPLQLGLTVKF